MAQQRPSPGAPVESGSLPPELESSAAGWSRSTTAGRPRQRRQPHGPAGGFAFVAITRGGRRPVGPQASGALRRAAPGRSLPVRLLRSRGRHRSPEPRTHSDRRPVLVHSGPAEARGDRPVHADRCRRMGARAPVAPALTGRPGRRSPMRILVTGSAGHLGSSRPDTAGRRSRSRRARLPAARSGCLQPPRQVRRDQGLPRKNLRGRALSRRGKRLSAPPAGVSRRWATAREPRGS